MVVLQTAAPRRSFRLSDVPAVLARPGTWVAAAVLLLALAPAEDASATAAVSPSDLAIVVAALCAVRQILRSERLRMVRSVPALGFFAIALMSLVAAALATNFPQNLVGGIRFVELFLFAPVAVMVALRTRADAVVVVGSLLGLGLVEGLLGLFQYATGTGAGIGEESIRAVGTFGAYNIGTLSHLTAMSYVICLAVAVVRRGAGRWWGAAGAVFFVVANAATLSRGAWVAMALATVVVVSRGRPVRLLATVGAAALAAALIVPPLVSSGSAIGTRLESLLSADSAPDQSLLDREALWRGALQMALDHPFTGVGPRAFPDFRDAYADFSLLGSSDISFGSTFERVELKSPHSLYLLIAGEQGLLALLVFVTVLAVLLARGLARAARPRSDLSTTVTLMGVGVLAYELVAMVTGDLGGPGSILTGVALGLSGWAAADLDLLRPARAVPDAAPAVRTSAGSPS
ncbi:O-antigen ligase family protein [Geodermatophilus sp. URMC 64]